MRSSDDFKNRKVISVSDGRDLGTVADLYIDSNFYWLTGIYLKSEGLFRRRAILIPRDRVTLFGVDVILVDDSDAVTNDRDHEEAKNWVRLKDVTGRTIDTPGGTKIATLKSVLLDESARVVAIELDKTYIEGPISDHGYVPRNAVIDSGHEDGGMTVDIHLAEQLMEQPLTPADPDNPMTTTTEQPASSAEPAPTTETDNSDEAE
ncbi:MAG TPA: PRC-barrel domain-containing protein [Anaerolineae bacterium]|nr:PRC-barrel domain-containing protein [Anaerolineae bacterium]